MGHNRAEGTGRGRDDSFIPPPLHFLPGRNDKIRHKVWKARLRRPSTPYASFPLIARGATGEEKGQLQTLMEA